jgi:hypothetical protein
MTFSFMSIAAGRFPQFADRSQHRAENPGLKEMTVTESRKFGFGSYRFCSCCSIERLTRRQALAAGAGALLAAQLNPIVPARAATPASALDPWLNAHGNVAKALVWDFGKGGQPYATWPAPAKARLHTAFELAVDGKPSGLVDPPHNVATYSDTDYPHTVISGTNAFALHTALVANSLVAEIGHRVPWSIIGYSDSALATLFDGRQTFTRSNVGPDTYRILRASVPAPPEVCLAFLNTNKWIGADRHQTIVNALSWSRHLSHFVGANAAKNNEEHWHYRGQPPASRVMSGTLYTGTGWGNRVDLHRRFTAGCWGTTNFLASVLRTVNIPVQEIEVSGIDSLGKLETHSGTYFAADGLCLSHGDDPYSAYCNLQPSFRIAEILISKRQFDVWFPPGKKPVAGQPMNIGRRPAELAVKYLPIYLMNAYAQDVAAKTTHENGKVFQYLRDKYSLAQLNATKLWPRLDARLAEIGGPDKVRALYVEAEQARERAGQAPGAH